MTDLKTAGTYILVAGGAVFLCRALPFLIIRSKKGGNAAGAETSGDSFRPGTLDRFLSLVERVVPPVAMTVLACNSIAAPVKEDPGAAVPILCAAALSLVAQLWRGNFLLSILGGTALYMLLIRLI
ncbi:MAG: AzlD domain-containing protein [Spirochaetaceae bacterium]|jgi:branched-subunit amino acid transport protein AzlD|nr:AzlD domain-containing protein [Spirochaetaceae bacterium]